MTLPKGSGNRPCRQLVLAMAEASAFRHGAAVGDVLGGCHRPVSTRARHEAWAAILAATGCSMNGLANVWGCDRQAIRRAKIRLENAA